VQMSAPDTRLAVLADVMTGQYLQDLYTCIFVALTRAHPNLTRDEFDNHIAIGVLEAMEAITVIAKQTGLIKFQTLTGAPVTGEVTAAAPLTGGQ